MGGLTESEFKTRRIDKPWGYELIWAFADGLYCGKVLFVRGGQALSLQFHEVKDETIFVQHGQIELTVADDEGTPEHEIVSAGRSFRIAPQTVHRVRAVEDSTLLEVSTPELDDVVRLEDMYARGSA